MSAKDISFIIPLFNHVEQSRTMLESLLRTVPSDLDYEVILIDDASRDGTRAWMNEVAQDRIRLLFNEGNQGYAKTNNRAAAVATGTVLGLLNNDLIMLDGWLEPMLDVLQSVRDAGIVGNVQQRVGDDAVDHAGVAVDHFAKIEHIRSLPSPDEKLRRAFAVTGACCLLRREDFEAVGGLDEQYVNGGEDIDLCMKLRARHSHPYVACRSHIRHHVSLSRGGASEQAERNSRLLFRRWKPVILQETKGAWLRILSSPAEASSARAMLDFYLSDAYQDAPHAVAGILARSAVLREETRWREILDGDDSHTRGVKVESVRGFVWDGTDPFPWIDRSAHLSLPASAATRTVTVKGVVADDDWADEPDTAMDITIGINGVQRRTWTVRAGQRFDIGVPRPASVPGHPTMATVTVTRPPDAAGRSGLPATAVRFEAVDADGRRVLDLRH